MSGSKRYLVFKLRKAVFVAFGVCMILALLTGGAALLLCKQPNSHLYTTSVGMTYYGGHFDEQEHEWIVDNTYQCNRIKSGEFSADLLDATPTVECDDDPGVGYFDNIPLHNTMSYAELSVDPSQQDYSALGDLPSRTRLRVEYAGRCAILEKLDVGGGGGPVNGHQRSIDLWWQTARSLGFTNGFDIAKVTYVSQDTPLTPLGQASDCEDGASEAYGLGSVAIAIASGVLAGCVVLFLILRK